MRNKRIVRKLSLREVAIRMEVSAAYLSDLELGRRNWDEAKIEAFNKALKQ